MTVRDLIERLKQFDLDLPVCLADWQEGWERPSESEAEKIGKTSGKYIKLEGTSLNEFNGPFVCIGDDS